MVELKVFNNARQLADVFLSPSCAATVATRVSDAMNAGRSRTSDPVCREDAGIPDYRPRTTTAAESWLSFVGAASKLLTRCVVMGFQLFPTSYLLVL